VEALRLTFHLLAFILAESNLIEERSNFFEVVFLNGDSGSQEGFQIVNLSFLFSTSTFSFL